MKCKIFNNFFYDQGFIQRIKKSKKKIPEPHIIELCKSHNGIVSKNNNNIDEKRRKIELAANMKDVESKCSAGESNVSEPPRPSK